jgi:hypothetical protein
MLLQLLKFNGTHRQQNPDNAVAKWISMASGGCPERNRPNTWSAAQLQLLTTKWHIGLIIKTCMMAPLPAAVVATAMHPQSLPSRPGPNTAQPVMH